MCHDMLRKLGSGSTFPFPKVHFSFNMVTRHTTEGNKELSNFQLIT